MTKILGREDILNADDRKTELVDVPEWGGTVIVRALSGKDRDEYEASTIQIRGGQQSPDLRNATAKFVARAVVDEAGERLFSTSDVAALGEKNADALNRVFFAVAKLSGMSPEAIADAEENSDAVPSDSTTSD